MKISLKILAMRRLRSVLRIRYGMESFSLSDSPEKYVKSIMTFFLDQLVDVCNNLFDYSLNEFYFTGLL